MPQPSVTPAASSANQSDGTPEALDRAAPPPAPSGTPFDLWISRWGWLLGVVATLLLSGVIGSLGRLQISNFAILTLLLLGGVLWLTFVAFLIFWIEGSIAIVTGTAGRNCSILQDVQGARDYFMGEISQEVKALPQLDDESLDEVDDLLQKADVAKSIMTGLGTARELRKWVGLLVMALPPLLVLGALAVGDLPSGDAPTLMSLIAIGLLSYVLWIVILSSGGGRVVSWSRRVGRLSGENANGVRRLIERWAEERKA